MVLSIWAIGGFQEKKESRSDTDHILRDSPISSLFQSLSAESGWGQSRDPAQHSVLPDLAAEPIGDVAAGQACCSARMKDDRPRTRAAQSKLLKENKGGALSPPK